MDHQDQRKRAFSQAFHQLNQYSLGDNNFQVAKRVSSQPLLSTALYHHNSDQENETPLDLDYNEAFEQIPGTQIRHPPPVYLQYANPALYNYASLQYQLYGSGPGPQLKSDAGSLPPLAPKRHFNDPILCTAVPTPEIVRGHSMFGPSPYVRPDFNSALRDIIDSYAASRDSSMSDATTAVGPLTPSALHFGDLSLSSQANSVPSSPFRDDGLNNRAIARIVPVASFTR